MMNVYAFSWKFKVNLIHNDYEIFSLIANYIKKRYDTILNGMKYEINSNFRDFCVAHSEIVHHKKHFTIFKQQRKMMEYTCMKISF